MARVLSTQVSVSTHPFQSIAAASITSCIRGILVRATPANEADVQQVWKAAPEEFAKVVVFDLRTGSAVRGKKNSPAA